MLSSFMISPILADGGGSDHMGNWGWGFGWMMGGWLMMVLVVGLVVWALRGMSNPDGTGRGRSPKRILAERFADGVISTEEYEERLSVLRRRGK